ncbi:MAG TPA: HAD family hydrolase [bacterium]|nr:HAD family hydrolase [bacterium]
MKVKAVLIDLDDTLTATKHLYDEALGVCHEVFNKSTGMKLSEKGFKKLYKEAKLETIALVPTDAASHNRAIYFQRLVEKMDIQTDFDLIYQLYVTYYDYVYNNMEPYDGCEELLLWLKDEKKKIVIVSNGSTHVRLEKIHALGIGKYIDYLVSSEEVGIEKPSNQPFLVALNKAKVTTKQVVMIGNSASSDIYGGELLDMVTIQVDIGSKEKKPENKLQKPDYNVDNLSKIKVIIQKLES